MTPEKDNEELDKFLVFSTSSHAFAQQHDLPMTEGSCERAGPPVRAFFSTAMFWRSEILNGAYGVWALKTCPESMQANQTKQEKQATTRRSERVFDTISCPSIGRKYNIY